MRIDDALDGLHRAADKVQEAARSMKRAAEAQEHLTEAMVQLRDAARRLAHLFAKPVFTPEQEQRLEKAVREIEKVRPLTRN